MKVQRKHNNKIKKPEGKQFGNSREIQKCVRL